ncbi:MAG TPA: TMEM165/GDT1 family protein [Polyangia bacterium]|nr:TMEM165/GDT1 family protein [Polyangia bacterium]
MHWSAVAQSFALVAASEMGDKTQLLAFSLAGRFRRPWVIMAGILVATIGNHLLAATVGVQIAAHVSRRTMAIALAVTFVVFGLWTLKPDELDDDTKPSRFGPFLTTIVLFFLAEMGDKTQLATVALAARYRSVVSVTLGTTAGMMLADGLAVWLGDRLAARAQARWVRIAAAVLFFAFAAASAWDAAR